MALARSCIQRSHTAVLRSRGMAAFGDLDASSKIELLDLRLALGLIAVAAVPRRLFLIFALGIGSSIARRYRACV